MYGGGHWERAYLGVDVIHHTLTPTACVLAVHRSAYIQDYVMDQELLFNIPSTRDCDAVIKYR